MDNIEQEYYNALLLCLLTLLVVMTGSTFLDPELLLPLHLLNRCRSLNLMQRKAITVMFLSLTTAQFVSGFSFSVQ